MPALKGLNESGVGIDGQSEGHVAQRLMAEFVKSYGAAYDEDTNEWSWNLQNYGAAWKEQPIWTALDHATLLMPVGKLATAARAVSKGSGAAGMALKAAEGGAKVAALEEGSTTLGGRLIGRALGHDPKMFSRAVELEKRAPARSRLGRAFESPVAGLRRGADDDYLSLIEGGYAHEGDRRAFAQMLDRERRAAMEVEKGKAADVAMALRGLDAEAGANVTRALEMGGLRGGLDAGVRGGGNRAQRRLAAMRGQGEAARGKSVPQAFAVGARAIAATTNAAGKSRLEVLLKGDEKAMAAYNATWTYREGLHRKAFEMGLITRDDYVRNLGRYAPHLYEEFLQAEKAAGTAKVAGGTLDSFKARTLPRQEEALSRRVSKLRNRAEELRQFAAADPKARKANAARAGALDRQAAKLLKRKDAVGAQYTRVLDPSATAGRLLQTAQAITKQDFVRKLSNSVVSAPDAMGIVQKAAAAGNASAARLVAMKAAGVRVSQTALDDVVEGELGWRKARSLYPNRELPKYLKRLESTGILDRYIDPAAAETLFGKQGMMKFADEPVFEELFNKGRKALAFFRSSKTIMNPATHMRNSLSGIIFRTMATGSFALNPVKGYKALKTRGRDFQEAMASGVLGGNDHNITLELLRKAGVDLEDANPYKLKFLGDSKVGKLMADGHEKAANLYRLEDDMWKMDAFLTQRDKYLKAGLARDQAISRATLDVAKFMPSFNQVSPFTQLVSQAVPFASFTNEAIRIWKNAMIEKPHVAMFWQHFGGAWTEAVGAAQGYSQENLTKIKESMPNHQQGKPAMLVPWKINDQPHFFDLSYIIPLAGNMGEIGNEANKNFFVSDFYDISGNPFVGAAIIAATGQDPFTGKPVEPRFAERQLGANIENPTARKYLGLGEWMAATMAPPLAPPGYANQNLMELVRGQVDPATAQPLEPDAARTIAANIFGLRTYEATLSSAVLNSRIEADQIQQRIEHQWKVHTRARANGDTALMQDAYENLIDLRMKLDADPEKAKDYLAQGIKQREPGKHRTLSTRHAREILEGTEGLELSPEQLEIRGEIMARVQERTAGGRKRKKRSKKRTRSKPNE